MSEFEAKQERRITNGPRPNDTVKDPSSLIESFLTAVDDYPASTQSDILQEIRNILVNRYTDKANDHYSRAKEFEESASILKKDYDGR